MEMNELFTKVEGLVKDQAAQYKAALTEQQVLGKANSEKLEALDKRALEIEKYTNLYNDLKAANDELKTASAVIEAKFKDLERFGLLGGKEPQKSLGERFTDSEEFKQMMAEKGKISRKFEVGQFQISTKVDDITSAAAASSLVGTQRLSGITPLPNVPLTVRTLLPVGRTSSNAIQYVKENVFTNNAGPQVSPVSPTTSNVYDGALKNKSNITFTLVNTAVTTIAHYMKASRQILDDAPMLQSEINNRLLYGLALEEEEQLLLGDGQNGNLLGLIPQATAYNTALNVSGDTKIDKIAHALLQVMLAKYLPNAIVLSPQDWHDIQLVKTEEGGANKGSYVFSNPAQQTDPRLWGYRVVPSLSMNAGDFLVGNFATGAQIFDRMNATVEVARQNEDDFIRNMVSILAEMREALAVYTPLAFVEGSF